MNVSELINILSGLDKDAEVSVDDHGADLKIISVKEHELEEGRKLVRVIPGTRLPI